MDVQNHQLRFRNMNVSTDCVFFAIGLFLSLACGQEKVLGGGPRPIPGGESHYAKLTTNKVHYVTVGQGAHTLVFVHGWAGNTTFWFEQVLALKEKARLILIDLPGHGQSDKPDVDYTMDYFARGVLAAMRDAGSAKVTLIGHSMGVPVICRVYAQAPENVSGLVAVDGFLRRPDFNSPTRDQFLAGFRTPEYREHVSRFIGSMFRDPATSELRDGVVAEVLKTPQHVLSSSLQNIFDPK
ncbi:MAG TPA: alpha/beta hydrolase, partial [Aggregatilineaceae bacterium]|nr:alpha/beta hydrolase [Aggregatilineaceae bacterium]